MKKLTSLLLALMCTLLLAACNIELGDNGSFAGHSPSRSARGTYSAVLCQYNNTDPSTLLREEEVNWSADTAKTESYMPLELNGICTISIPTNGDESLDGKQMLKSIKLTMRNSNGQEVSLPGTLNYNHFAVDGNTFTFVPNYFDEGEKITVIAEFSYQRDGLRAMIEGFTEPTIVRGYYTFTVGKDNGARLAWNANTDDGESESNDNGIISSIINGGEQLWNSITGSEDGASIGEALNSVGEWWDSLDIQEGLQNLDENAQELWKNFQNTLAISTEIPESIEIEWGTTDQLNSEGEIIRKVLLQNREDPRISPNTEDDRWMNYPLHVLPDGTIIFYARDPDVLKKYDFTGANITLRAVYNSEGTKLESYSAKATDNFVAVQPSDPQNSTQPSNEEMVDTYKSVSPICGIGETEKEGAAFYFHLPMVEYYSNYFNEKLEQKAFQFKEQTGNILVFEVTFYGHIRENHAEEEGIPEGVYNTTLYFAVQVVDRDWWNEIYGDIVVPGDGNK